MSEAAGSATGLGAHRRERFPYLSGIGLAPLAGLALLTGAATATVAGLLLSRPALRLDLEVGARSLDQLFGAGFLAIFVGAIIGSLCTDGAVARNLLRFNGFVGGVASIAIVGINDPAILAVLIGLVVLTSAAALALTRAAAPDLYGRVGGWRVVAGCWAGGAAGVGLAGLHEFVAPIPNWGNTLGGAGVAALAGAALLLDADRRLAGLDAEVRAARLRGGPGGSALPSAPFVLLAVAAGVGLVAVFPVGYDHLATRWALDGPAIGGVVALAGLGAMVGLVIGHWYHHLRRRSLAHLGGACGAAATSAALLVASGGASKYLIGIVGCWAVVGLCAGLAVTAAETAVLAGAPPAWRFRSASSLVAAGAVGAMAVSLGPTVVDSVTRGWVLALASAPLVFFGLIVARTHPEDVAAPAARPLVAAPPVAPPTSPVLHAVATGEVTGDVIGDDAIGDLLARAMNGAPAPVAAPSTGSTPVAGQRGAGRGVLLDCEGLHAGYDGVQVLFDAGLRVHEGEIVALMGTNGAGKTTMLRTIAGLLAADRGTVTFGGVDITTFDPTWRVALGMSQIAGGSAVAEGLTVTENLRLFGHSLGRDRARLARGMDAAFDLFPRLAERRNQAASTLSGGEKQMLALSKAVILRPRLLVIDEFSLGLAPKIVGELLPIVSQLNEDGAAVLLIEQSVNIALSVAHHAYCMEKGEIVFDGPASQLRDDPDLIRAVYLEGLTKALAR